MDNVYMVSVEMEAVRVCSKGEKSANEIKKYTTERNNFRGFDRANGDDIKYMTKTTTSIDASNAALSRPTYKNSKTV